jgi:hypothetical protein
MIIKFDSVLWLYILRSNFNENIIRLQCGPLKVEILGRQSSKYRVALLIEKLIWPTLYTHRALFMLCLLSEPTRSVHTQHNKNKT